MLYENSSLNKNIITESAYFKWQLSTCRLCCSPQKGPHKSPKFPHFMNDFGTCGVPFLGTNQIIFRKCGKLNVKFVRHRCQLLSHAPGLMSLQAQRLDVGLPPVWFEAYVMFCTPKISGLMNCECAEALCQALSSRVDFTPGPEAGCGPSSSREELLLLSKLVFVHVHF